MHPHPSIYLTDEEKPGGQLGDYLMKFVRPVIASNEVLYLQMTSVGLQGTSERKRDRKKERTESINGILFAQRSSVE